MGISGSFPGENQLRQSGATKPTVCAGHFSVSMIHRILTWTTGSLTCAQMLMHAIAHGGVRTHEIKSALKVTLGGKKSLATPGIEPASAACRSDTVPVISPLLIIYKYNNLRRQYLPKKRRKKKEKKEKQCVFLS